MAADEARKKWGTIFMGEREASVEQLDAMQEPLRRDKIRKEQTEDYMERVRKRAADRKTFTYDRNIFALGGGTKGGVKGAKSPKFKG